MFSDHENIIFGFIESMLPRFSKKLALKMRFKLTLDYWADECSNALHETRFIEFVIHRPSNYTQVYYRIGDDYRTLPQDWVMAADHDSCWRDAFRILDKLSFDMEKLFEAKKINLKHVFTRLGFDLNGQPTYITLEKSTSKNANDLYNKVFNLELGNSVSLGKIQEFLREIWSLQDRKLQ